MLSQPAPSTDRLDPLARTPHLPHRPALRTASFRVAIDKNAANGRSVLRGRGTTQAFTLIELLVAIAIIGVLVSLLVPAVGAAREAARRVQCQNNLKQLGLAVIQYETAWNAYPTGGWNWDQPPTFDNGRPVSGKEQRAGWGFQVLPYLEATTVWQSDPITAIGATESVFFCPTRRGPQQVTWRDAFDPPLAAGAELPRGLCDYAASNHDNTGVIQRYEPVRPRHVKDGLSATLLIADKRLNRAKLGQAQEDDNEGYTAGWNSDTIRRTDKRPQPDFFSSADLDGDNLFGSSHPGVFNAVYLDGSVHVLTYDLDLDTFRSAGHIRDGKVATQVR